mmetsp:Transcript_99923/g.287162  ORF Transcript_99923/g.287162 Transcript_99923/m.287162 type:complete len:428 (-) Transcript_99923:390-1673(-)
MTDRHEGGVHDERGAWLAGVGSILELDVGQGGLDLAALQGDVLSDVLRDLRVPQHLDVRVVEHALLQHQARSEGVAPVNELHVGADARQHERLLHGRVATADNRARPALEKVAVAGRAARHAVTSQVPFALYVQPAAVGARRDDERVGSHEAALVRHDLEGLLRCVDLDDGIVPDLGEEAPRLLLHDLDHLPTVFARHPWVVLDVDALRHELTAKRWRDDQRAQVRTSSVDRRRHTGGPAADDDHLLDRAALRPVPVQAAWIVREALLLLLEALHDQVLLAALQLLPQLFDGGGLQVRALRARGATPAARLRAHVLVVDGLLRVLALLRRRRLAVLLLQQADHGGVVLRVFLDDRVDALLARLRGVMLLVEGLERLAGDLNIVALELLDQPLCPLAERVLVRAGKLVPLLALYPELERGHRPDALRA